MTVSHDETLASIVESLSADFTAAHMTRQRGGMIRGVAWAEVAGRGDDSAWYELRMHHKPGEKLVQAGMLAYQSLAKGGRTIVIGESYANYTAEPSEVIAALVSEISAWVDGVQR